jgi:hypothetical protein
MTGGGWMTMPLTTVVVGVITGAVSTVATPIVPKTAAVVVECPSSQ